MFITQQMPTDNSEWPGAFVVVYIPTDADGVHQYASLSYWIVPGTLEA